MSTEAKGTQTGQYGHGITHKEEHSVETERDICNRPTVIMKGNISWLIVKLIVQNITENVLSVTRLSYNLKVVRGRNANGTVRLFRLPPLPLLVNDFQNFTLRE